MSSIKINDSLIEQVVGRIKEEYRLKENKQLAELIGLSQQNFSKKKSKGTVLNDILEWSLKTDKDLNFIFKGQVQLREEKKDRDVFLENIVEWISKKLNEDPRNKNWFEVEFEKAFDEFKKWKEEKEESEAKEASTSTRKVA